jgi:urease accessory protein
MNAVATSGWEADLALSFERRRAGTVLIHNRHRGPLQVQKALYPEGPDTCHVAVLHPPGGIAATDRLALRASLGDEARVLLTTPGATKWYRADAAWARAHQDVRLSVGEGAVLEWLPRESIVFDGARIATTLEVTLAPSAAYFGWEILSFGRRASGERWSSGTLDMRTCIRRDDRLLWSELASLEAGSGFTRSAVGLSGHTVCGTFVVAGPQVGDELLGDIRVRQAPAAARVGITRVPSVLIARYLGDSTEAAFDWFSGLWTTLRPALTQRPACAPRVWAC